MPTYDEVNVHLKYIAELEAERDRYRDETDATEYGFGKSKTHRQLKAENEALRKALEPVLDKERHEPRILSGWTSVLLSPAELEAAKEASDAKD